MRPYGIDHNFVAPEHSVTGKPEVIFGEDGEPTGVIKELDSMLVLPRLNSEELRACIASGLKSYFTDYGVTTIARFPRRLPASNA